MATANKDGENGPYQHSSRVQGLDRPLFENGRFNIRRSQSRLKSRKALTQFRRSGAAQLGAIPCGSPASELQSPLARPPDYDESSARRDHQVSAAVSALLASRMPSPTSPAVAAQCRGTRARAPGSHRYSSGVNGSGAVLS